MKYFRIALFLSGMALQVICKAQSVPPQGISYQAIARDTLGNIISNQVLGIQFSIRTGTSSGPIEWQETHSVETNEFGLFMTVIGQGTTTTVGSAATFGEVEWFAAQHFLQVDIQHPILGWQLLGTSELLSVPYAFYAETSGGLQEVDGDVTNELITEFYFANGIMNIVEGGIIHQIDFVGFWPDDSPDNELIDSVIYDEANNELTINETGNSFTVDLTDLEDGYWQMSDDETDLFNETQQIGIGTTQPTSTLEINGSYAAGFISINGPELGFNLNENHQVVLCNVAMASVVLNLPTADGCPGRIYKIKRNDADGFASNPVNIVPSAGDMIEAVPGTFQMSWVLMECVEIISDGQNWWILNHYMEQP